MQNWPNTHTKINFVIMGLLTILFFAPAFAVEYDIETIESVSIIGTKADARKIAGSGTVISNEDLQKTIDTDIHKILSAVPGVFFRTEDGYGLRPNISIRGTTHDASISKPETSTSPPLKVSPASQSLPDEFLHSATKFA